MDYSRWVMDVATFFEQIPSSHGSVVSVEIAPPLTESEFSAIAQSWPREIPNALKGFWTTGSSHLNCSYYYERETNEAKVNQIFPRGESVSGGPELEAAKDIFPGNSGLTQGDEFADEEECRQFCEAAIFYFGPGGDHLALDLTSESDDPPVVHLGEDSETTFVISPSFTDFLENWAQISYIGIDCLAKYWRDEVSGFINPEKHKSAELRSLILTGN